MEKNIGFIGAGNMGSAIIGGMIESKTIQSSHIMVSDLNVGRLEALAKSYKIATTSSNIDIAKMSDILFLAVKPDMYRHVIGEINEYLKTDVVIVSIAAGITIEEMYTYFDDVPVKIIRTMPNTPSLVNKGITAVCLGENVTDTDAQATIDILSSIGKVEILPEYLFHAFIGVAGSSPAYVYMLIDAMADAGVKYGLTKEQAIKMSAKAVLGTAQMVLDLGEHPMVLKDRVCSPGGTTIEAVCTLEEQGFRNAVITAISDCVEKSMEMEKRKELSR